MAPLHRVRSVFSLCLHTPVRQSWFSRPDGTTISGLRSHGWAAALVANTADKHANTRVTSSPGRPKAIPLVISRCPSFQLATGFEPATFRPTEQGARWQDRPASIVPKPPLTPFADELPLPRRLIASEEGNRLTIPIRTGTHRFHRDLPESSVWGFEATFPG